MSQFFRFDFRGEKFIFGLKMGLFLTSCLRHWT